MDPDLDEEELEDVILDEEIEFHWTMISKDYVGGGDDKKEILNDKRWSVYMKEKLLLLKGGHSMEVSGSYEKKFIWEAVENNFVEE